MNMHDPNAIIVMTRSDEPKILGHLKEVLQLHDTDFTASWCQNKYL